MLPPLGGMIKSNQRKPNEKKINGESKSKSKSTRDPSLSKQSRNCLNDFIVILF